jgi:hypothetical protein
MKEKYIKEGRRIKAYVKLYYNAINFFKIIFIFSEYNVIYTIALVP